MQVGRLYSNEEIIAALGVSNAGGIRPCLTAGVVRRVVLMTSLHDVHAKKENPYYDRLEGDILTYTAAGKTGQQTLAGMNGRLIEQKESYFPIHGFEQVASRRDKTTGPRRWKYLGLLQYLRHYPDTQLDTDGKPRRVWLVELRVHTEPALVPAELDAEVWRSVVSHVTGPAADDEVVSSDDASAGADFDRIEGVRGRLLALEPRRFEFLIKDLLVHVGFQEVCVTKATADGGVDVNAKAGPRMWLFEDTVVQVQAKRWLHSVGRKEVAELRGSLQPHARGAVMTTGHFSRAAIGEATEAGKNPIGLVDGFALSRMILTENFVLPG